MKEESKRMEENDPKFVEEQQRDKENDWSEKNGPREDMEKMRICSHFA